MFEFPDQTTFFPHYWTDNSVYVLDIWQIWHDVNWIRSLCLWAGIYMSKKKDLPLSHTVTIWVILIYFHEIMLQVWIKRQIPESAACE